MMWWVAGWGNQVMQVLFTNWIDCGPDDGQQQSNDNGNDACF